MVKKFITLDCTQDVIELTEVLEKLESATLFDPKKSKATRGDNLLWDYQKKFDSSNEIPEVFPILKEDLRYLKRQAWQKTGMPNRFITEAEWEIYQNAFDTAPNKPEWLLAPIFVPNPGKKISTWTHHYFKIKKLVEESFKRGEQPLKHSNRSALTIKNFGAGVLVSIALIINPYMDSDIDFVGDPPSSEEPKRDKLSDQDDEIEKIIHEMKLDIKQLPIVYAGNRFSVKIEAWKKAALKENLFPSKTAFDHSWRRLKRSGRIQYSEEELLNAPENFPSPD